MRRWLPAALLGAFVLLGAALWFGPRLLDWEPWRPQIAEIASTRLGRPVTLDGPITLALLPQPRIEARAITIGPAADGMLVNARALRLRLDLGALLSGRLEPREIAIVNGEIRLPWPPTELPSFRPPAWLTVLDARLEDCRLLIGGLRLERLNARLVTGGVNEALVAEGSFAWAGQAVRFGGQLGRAGFDGAAPLDLSLAGVGATFTTRGVLQPGGGYEGRMEAAGTDLAALLPSPPGPFRATGRLTASGEVVAADDLGLDLGGQPARGAAALRLVPAPRLDIALVAGRLDLDAWVAAARGAGGRNIPVGIDLSAETTALGGMPLRRLRGAFFLEGERLTLSDVSALLPGETTVELAGATAGPRLEIAVRFGSANLREALAAIGLPVEGTDPVRLRRADGRFRLALQDGQAAISDLAATVDGARLGGAGAVRLGAARPGIGLGLTVDVLDLRGLLPAAAGWTAVPASLTGFDLNLRLAAERVLVAAGDLPLSRATLDATLENGRLSLRRLGLRLAELDVALSGTATFSTAQGQPPARLSDLALEVSGTAGPAVAALLPAWVALPALPAEMPVAVRLSGGGMPEALALRAEGDLGELRIEAQGTLDATVRRGGGSLTLRHPGAPRLLAPVLGDTDLADWLGQGSFALIATGSAGPHGVTADSFDLGAAGLRARGQLALDLTQARPRLTAGVTAERLPLPDLFGANAGRLPGLAPLRQADLEVAVEAAVVRQPGLPPLEAVSVQLRQAGGVLRLEGLRARLGGGRLEGTLALEAAEPDPPRLALEVKLETAIIGAPVLGLPSLDLGAGRVTLAAALRGTGHGLEALLATLGGEATLEVADGQLLGYDLPAVQTAAMLPEMAAAEAGMRRALLGGGAMAFERLSLRAVVADGRVTLESAGLGAEGSGAATAEGSVDLGRMALDLVISTTPIPAAPSVRLRITGPVAEPRRLPDLAPFLRWKAEQG